MHACYSCLVANEKAIASARVGQGYPWTRHRSIRQSVRPDGGPLGEGSWVILSAFRFLSICRD
jgi:hypothetical protein